MTALLAQLPSLRIDGRDVPGREQHQRLNSASSSPIVENVEMDIGTHANGRTSPAITPTSAKWKGKGKEVVRPQQPSGTHSDDAMQMTRAEEEEEESRGLTMSNSDPTVGAYPPMTDEDVEAAKIEENLKRYELVEKQRRKAARESRNARAPSTVVGDVSRRASSLFRTGSLTRRSSSSGEYTGAKRTPLKTRDSEDVELSAGGGGGLATIVDSEPGGEGTLSHPAGKDQQRRPSTSSTNTVKSNATMRSGPNNPFSSNPSKYQEDPFNPPSPSSSPPSRQAPASSKGDVAVNDGDEDEDTQATPTKKKDLKRRSTIPPPQVLTQDLPQPRLPPSMMEPNADAGHWRRVTEQQQTQADMMEEEERDRRQGRWWTDWLCGCREAGPHPRNDQAGRTNPFE